MNIFKVLAHSKVFYSRAAIYVSVLNFLMILGTFKATYNINISIFIIIPLGLFLILMLGFIDYKLVMAQEIKFSNKQNNIKSQLDIIEKKLEFILKKEDKR